MYADSFESVSEWMILKRKQEHILKAGLGLGKQSESKDDFSASVTTIQLDNQMTNQMPRQSLSPSKVYIPKGNVRVSTERRVSQLMCKDSKPASKYLQLESGNACIASASAFVKSGLANEELLGASKGLPYT